MKIVGLIPARYASTRFPAKPLADIGGKSMIQHVYEQVKKSKLNKVVVATDHPEIFDHVKKFGGEVCMTKDSHVSGTDRCYEAFTLLNEKYHYVINIQGDEPFIKPEQINHITSLLNGLVEIATLMKAIDDPEQLFNPNVVKVTVNKKNEALYFSRATIPHLRNIPQHEWFSKHTFYKHLGMYAYRTDILQQLTTLPVSSLEKAESLEQLRWLEHGFKISIAETTFETVGIDTPDDLAKALKSMSASNG